MVIVIVIDGVGAGGCPDFCSFNGICVDDACVCDAGHTGPSCNETECGPLCSDRGTCNQECALLVLGLLGDLMVGWQ